MLPSLISQFLFAGSVISFLARPAFFLDPRIARGATVTDIKQHPYQLSLQRGLRHACGAVIVSNKWVVTAAHCVSAPANVYRLHAGSTDKYGGVYYPVKKIVRHPAYNFLTIDYDIALLEIDGEIAFNDRVQPAKLPKREPAGGIMANVTGWGAATEGGEPSPVLMKVTLPVVSRETCREIYKSIRRITDRMICAGYMHGGQDACEGDSGGPLTADGIFYGIVSWGYKCAEPSYPGVYTNVANLLWWIKWISHI
ncbi:hypothetical protein PUN28_004007 [Cardiocondyla obscurior]|uniref:Peptidase S1 domain-containing protein n=1 Tax=Cardiocondyla obscurior TaxID=286306 RepID=A0AAW2GMV2_9HYME